MLKSTLQTLLLVILIIHKDVIHAGPCWVDLTLHSTSCKAQRSRLPLLFFLSLRQSLSSKELWSMAPFFKVDDRGAADAAC